MVPLMIGDIQEDLGAWNRGQHERGEPSAIEGNLFGQIRLGEGFQVGERLLSNFFK